MGKHSPATPGWQLAPTPIDGVVFLPLAKTRVNSELIGVWREEDGDGVIKPLLAEFAALA